MSSINIQTKTFKNVVVQVTPTTELNLQLLKLHEKKCQFHLAMKNVLTMAQCFGLLPFYGVKDTHIENIKFKWMSFKTIFSIVILCLVLINGILYLVEFAREDLNFQYLVSTTFYICQAISYALFIKLARKWYDLNKVWHAMEKTMEKYSYQPNNYRRFKITTIVLMSLALFEHFFSIMKSAMLSAKCPNADIQPIKAYFGLCCSNVFTLTTYAHWKAVVIEIPIIMSTFAWNFSDLFLILISAALAEKFKQINVRVLENELQDTEFWKEIREDYNKLWTLCKKVDSMINNHVTLSFACNLIFICWQMFNSLKPKEEMIHLLYFFYSLGFLLGRTATVCVYCCWINDESKEVLTALFQVPTAHFCIDAERLIQQITSFPAVLTGSNFFQVTRGACLQVASAIITFEIILVQLGPSYLQTDSVRKMNCLTETQD